MNAKMESLMNLDVMVAQPRQTLCGHAGTSHQLPARCGA